MQCADSSGTHVLTKTVSSPFVCAPWSCHSDSSTHEWSSGQLDSVAQQKFGEESDLDSACACTPPDFLHCVERLSEVSKSCLCKLGCSSGATTKVLTKTHSELTHQMNAHAQRFLTLKGSGYRKERKGSPLANIFRQWCDASALPCIVVAQGSGTDPLDTVVLDLVTLRQTEVETVRCSTLRLCSLPCRCGNDEMGR